MVRTAVILLMLSITLPVNAGEPLAVRLTPNVALAPALLTVRAVIEADADNRALEVVAVSSDYYRSSVVPLDGANAPRLNVIEFKNLPPGTYEVTSILIGTSGERGAVANWFRVAPAVGSSR
jgi:hypothetical protein